MVTLEQLFPGDSELSHLMRELDWSTTDLGAPEGSKAIYVARILCESHVLCAASLTNFRCGAT